MIFLMPSTQVHLCPEMHLIRCKLNFDKSYKVLGLSKNHLFFTWDLVFTFGLPYQSRLGLGTYCYCPPEQ